MRTRALALAILLVAAAPQEKTRVACVGDSITYGAGVEDRANTCYPVMLGKFLGDGYDVRNFGVSGATLLKKGDKPYWNQKAFKEAGEFNPNVAVIKLGTNDTKPQNWKAKADFEGDYRSLLRHFKELPSKPKVYVALPVAVLKPNFGINGEAMAEELPLIRNAAREESCPIIDLQLAVSAAELFNKDGIHPNAAGAKKIAETVQAALASEKK